MASIKVSESVLHHTEEVSPLTREKTGAFRRKPTADSTACAMDLMGSSFEKLEAKPRATSSHDPGSPLQAITSPGETPGLSSKEEIDAKARTNIATSAQNDPWNQELGRNLAEAAFATTRVSLLMLKQCNKDAGPEIGKLHIKLRNQIRDEIETLQSSMTDTPANRETLQAKALELRSAAKTRFYEMTETAGYKTTKVLKTA